AGCGQHPGAERPAERIHRVKGATCGRPLSPRRSAVARPPVAGCSAIVARGACALRAHRPETQKPRPGRGFASRTACPSGFGLRTIDQFDVRHRRVVAGAEAALEDAQVAARTAGVARAQGGEQVADRFLVAQAREGEAAVGDAVDLGQGHQRLGDAAQFLGLGQGGLDQLVLEQRGGHVAEHGFAVGAGAVELAAGFLVAHGRGSLSLKVGTLDIDVAFLALEIGLRMVLAGIPCRACRGLGSVGECCNDYGKTTVAIHGATARASERPTRLPWPGVRQRASQWLASALPYPSIPWAETPAGGQFSSFMPSDRPRWARTSLISVSDFLPRFGVLSSSTSVFWIRSPM